MELKSIFSNIAQSGEEEQFNLLAKSPNCRVERIVSA